MASWIKMDRGCGHKEEVRLSNGWYRMKAEKEEFFASACPICGYKKGTETDRPVAQTATVAPTQTAVGPGLPPHTQVRTNKYASRCRCCGRMVPAGKGHLFYIDPDEAYEDSGWIVECIDKKACQAEIDSKHEILAQQAKAYYVD